MKKPPFIPVMNADVGVVRSIIPKLAVIDSSGFPPMPRAVHRDDLHYWQRIEGLALPASAYLGEKL